MSKRPNVVSFIRKEREAGKSDEQIKHDLLDVGWQIDIINRALSKETTKVAPQTYTSAHFTKYSDWYTEKRSVYAGIGLLLLLVLIVLLA